MTSLRYNYRLLPEGTVIIGSGGMFNRYQGAGQRVRRAIWSPIEHGIAAPFSGIIAEVSNGFRERVLHDQ